MNRIIRRTIAAWQAWRFRRALPVIRELDRKEAEARRQHKPVRHYQKAKQRHVLDALRHG